MRVVQSHPPPNVSAFATWKSHLYGQLKSPVCCISVRQAAATGENYFRSCILTICRVPKIAGLNSSLLDLVAGLTQRLPNQSLPAPNNCKNNSAASSMKIKARRSNYIVWSPACIATKWLSGIIYGFVCLFTDGCYVWRIAACLCTASP